LGDVHKIIRKPRAKAQRAFLGQDFQDVFVFMWRCFDALASQSIYRCQVKRKIGKAFFFLSVSHESVSTVLLGMAFEHGVYVL